MCAKLPDYADPYALCDKAGIFSGQITLSGLPRLSPLLKYTDGVAEYTLAFGKDSDGRCYIDNRVKADLSLMCQRCLQVFDYPVIARTRLCPVTGIQEAAQLPDRYEPVQLTEGRLRLVDLIEDELILAIPDVALHEPVDCAVNLVELNQFNARRDAQDVLQSARENPFAALAELTVR